MDDQLTRPGTDRRARSAAESSAPGATLSASSVVYFVREVDSTDNHWAQVTSQDRLEEIQASPDQYELKILFTVPVDDLSRAPVSVVAAARGAMERIERRGAKVERRLNDRHPDEALEWDGELGVLAMKAGANELQSAVELTQKSSLKFTQVRTDDAAQAIRYIKYLTEVAGKSQAALSLHSGTDTATLVIPASAMELQKQIRSIPCDVPGDIQDGIETVIYRHGHRDALNSAAALIASQEKSGAPLAATPAAGQAGLAKLQRYDHLGCLMAPDAIGDYYRVMDVQELFAAPVAADTEQATDEQMARLREVLEKEFDCYRTHVGLIPWAVNALLDNSPHKAAPLATPADAGAGLADERIAELFEEACAHPMEDDDWAGVRAFVRVIEREVLARMSTSGAPVTAEPVATIHCRDFHELAMAYRAASFSTAGAHYNDMIDYIDSKLAAPADRDAIRNEALEEAAKVCDSVNNYDNPMTAGDCADAIRALKSMERAADAKGGQHG